MFERVFRPVMVSLLVGNVMAVLGGFVLSVTGARRDLEPTALRLGISVLSGGGLLLHVTLGLES